MTTELVTLTVTRALRGFASEARRLRAAAPLIRDRIRVLAAPAPPVPRTPQHGRSGE